MSDNNNNMEVSFDSLFKAGADHYDQHGSFEQEATLGTPTSSSVNTEDETTNIDSTQSSSETQVDPLSTEVENTGVPTTTSTIDYQQLYEQSKQESDAKIGLLYNRLNDLSSKYQAMLDMSQTSSTKKESENASDEYQESLQEFKEVYPDIAKAVEHMIRKEVEGTRKSVEDVIGQQVQPIRQYLEHNTREQYVAQISNAHPDIQSLIDSGVVVRWVNSLDPIRQAGAQTIMQNGNAQQVISLLNEFKLQNGSAGIAPAQLKSTPPSTPAASLFNREEEIAKRVVQLLGVPSNSSGLSVKPQGTDVLKSGTANYQTDLAAALKSWEQDNRR